LFYIVAAIVFAADLATKKIVSSILEPAQSIPIIKGLLNITYIQNTGVAFGLFPNQRIALVIIGVVVCAVILYYFSKAKKRDILLQIAFAIIFGGSLGNLFDRVFYGYVIDYIDVTFFSVFNFADIAINAGVLLILCDIFFKGERCFR
jgi:signal peptidase II